MAERASIIVVDDESDALAAMLDALTRRCGALSLAGFGFSRRSQEQ